MQESDEASHTAQQIPNIKVCSQCKIPLTAPLRCSRCKTASYCGAACQRAHWATHKPLCQIKPHLPSAPSHNVATVLPQSSNIEQMVRDQCFKRRLLVAKQPQHAFPPLLQTFSFTPSRDGLHENLLILLHGLGKTFFTTPLAQSLSLSLWSVCCVFTLLLAS